jgi:putative ABC transport system permease protein
MLVVLGALETGLIYGIMALGVYITYKILDFPDLTVDGSFPLGGALTASLLLKGVGPILVLPIAFCAGLLAGTITGLIHVKLRVQNLIAGIIVMTGLYTINLRIAGRSNLPLGMNMSTIFRNEFLTRLVPEALVPYAPLLLIFTITAVVKLVLDWYLRTKSGYLLRAVGDNDLLVTVLAKDKGTVKIIGLAIANGLVALAGALFVERFRSFDISMGIGTVVIGLASVIIGLAISRQTSWLKVTTSVIFGAILYRLSIAAAIRAGLPAPDLKLTTALLLLAILVISWDRAKKKVKPSRATAGTLLETSQTDVEQVKSNA